MKHATLSMKIFAVYLLFLSTVLIFIPEKILNVFNLTAGDMYWVRVVGVLLLVIAFYYKHAIIRTDIVFYHLSVWGRVIVFVCFLALVIFKIAPFQLALFGSVDLLGALWTYTALKRAKI